MLLSDLCKGRIGEQSVGTFCQRSPCHETRTQLIHEFARLALLVEDMRLHLINHRCYLHVGGKVNQMVWEEVAHADGTELAGLIGLLQVTIGSIAVAIRLVKKHEVDVVRLQLAQTLVDAFHGLALAIIGRPHL